MNKFQRIQEWMSGELERSPETYVNEHGEVNQIDLYENACKKFGLQLSYSFHIALAIAHDVAYGYEQDHK